MTPLFKKLNLGVHESILVLNAPESFEPELAKLVGIQIKRKPSVKSSVAFAMGFAITQAELDSISAKIAKSSSGDSVVWIAYPKGTSTKYQCEFNRDSGWKVLGEAGFEPVRMVAIDEDWSALRFRRAEYIKTLTRNEKMILSEAGKRRRGPE